jgi:virginiamycin A acetyltransferase
LKLELTTIKITAPYDTVKSDAYILIKYKDGSLFPIYSIGKDSYIVGGTLSTKGFHIMHIGRYCSLAHNLYVQINQNHDFTRVSTGKPCFGFEPLITQKSQLIIQNDVWIGAGSTIMGGIKISNGAVVAAYSHVVKDVPPYAIVGGNPAKIIKYRFSDEIIADLQNIAYWNWDDAKMEACKDDFGLTAPEFVKKHRSSAPPLISRTKPINLDDPQILFFPDFDTPSPIWRHVVDEYCKNPVGVLTICLADDKNLESREREIESYVASVYQGKGEIAEQIGGNEDELFAEADCYVTSRGIETVRRTCLADRYGVKIASGGDVPFLNELHK